MAGIQDEHISTILIGSRNLSNLRLGANSKLIINRNLHTKFQLYGENLEEVDQFKYIGAIITKYGSSDSEIKIRLVQATSVMIKLITIRNSKYIRFKLKYNLYRSLVLSILTYGYE